MSAVDGAFDGPVRNEAADLIRSRLRAAADSAGGTPRLARLVGVSRAYLDMLRAGTRRPGLGVALRLHHVAGIEPAAWVREEHWAWRQRLATMTRERS